MKTWAWLGLQCKNLFPAFETFLLRDVAGDASSPSQRTEVVGWVELIRQENCWSTLLHLGMMYLQIHSRQQYKWDAEGSLIRKLGKWKVWSDCGENAGEETFRPLQLRWSMPWCDHPLTLISTVLYLYVGGGLFLLDLSFHWKDHVYHQ